MAEQAYGTYLHTLARQDHFSAQASFALHALLHHLGHHGITKQALHHTHTQPYPAAHIPSCCEISPGTRLEDAH